MECTAEYESYCIQRENKEHALTKLEYNKVMFEVKKGKDFEEEEEKILNKRLA